MAVEALGGSVPGGDLALTVHPDDRVVRGLHQHRSQEQLCVGGRLDLARLPRRFDLPVSDGWVPQ